LPIKVSLVLYLALPLASSPSCTLSPKS
jgi:hypothetical protein